MKLLNRFQSLINYRHLIALIGLAAGALTLKQSFGVEIIDADSAYEYTVKPNYIGKIDLVTSRGGRTSSNIHRDGGYAIGINDESETDPILKKLNPQRYFIFSPNLEVSDNDLLKIIELGDSIRIKVAKQTIVSVGNASNWLISYDDYINRAKTRKKRFLLLGITLSGIAIFFWLAAIAIARKNGYSFLYNEKITIQNDITPKP